jgi:hypothetical protein
MADTVPNCKSWLGHKFEPRYSTAPPKGVDVTRGTAGGIALLVEAMTQRDYKGDVCVRCGCVVNQQAGA